MTNNPWIIRGYEIFALEGEAMLKVEQLAKDVGISKSSFYHHFVDINFFVDALLEHHLHMASIVAEKEMQATSINPGLIDVLVEHRIDLLFNRQLRLHAPRRKYSDVLAASNQQLGQHVAALWLNENSLNMSKSQAEALFTLALDQFFLQIHPSNLNRAWLEQYFHQLNQLGKQFN